MKAGHYLLPLLALRPMVGSGYFVPRVLREWWKLWWPIPATEKVLQGVKHMHNYVVHDLW